MQTLVGLAVQHQPYALPAYQPPDGDNLADRLNGVHISPSEGNCSDESEYETVQVAFKRFVNEQPRGDGSSNFKLGSKQYNKIYACFLAAEVHALYGTNDVKLHILQDLCRDAAVEPIPNTKTACKKVRRSL